MEPKQIIETLIDKIRNDVRYSDKLEGIITYKKDGIICNSTLADYLNNEFINVVKVGSDVDKLFSLIESKAIPNTKVVKKQETIKDNSQKAEYIESFISENKVEDEEFIQYIQEKVIQYMNDDLTIVLAGKTYTLSDLYTRFVDNKKEQELISDPNYLESSLIETIEYYLDMYYEKEIIDSILSSGITYREYLVSELKDKAFSQTEFLIDGVVTPIDEHIEKLYLSDLELMERDNEQPSLMSPLVMTNGEYSTENLQKLSDKEGEALGMSLDAKAKTINNDSVYNAAKDAIYNSKEAETIDNILNNIINLNTISAERVSILNELAEKKRMQSTKIKMNQDDLLVSIDERMDKLIGLLNGSLSIDDMNYIEKSIYDLKNSISLLSTVPKDIQENLEILNKQYVMKSVSSRVMSDSKDKAKIDFLTGIEFDIDTLLKPINASISGEMNSVNAGFNIKLDNYAKMVYDKLQKGKDLGILTLDEYNEYCQKVDNIFAKEKNKNMGV